MDPDSITRSMARAWGHDQGKQQAALGALSALPHLDPRPKTDGQCQKRAAQMANGKPGISGYGYPSTKLGELTRMPYSGETGAGTVWGWGVGLAMG
jgi:hypothetical protein